MLLTESGGRVRVSVCWCIFADGCWTVAATKQRCTPWITGAKSKKPKKPQQSCSLLALPLVQLWGPCPGPVCHCPLALRASLSHSRECGDVLRHPGFPFALGYRHPARMGLVRRTEFDALAEVAAMELVKKHPAPHI